MRKGKFLFVFCLLLVFVMLFAACTQKDPADKNNNPSDPQGPTGPTETVKDLKYFYDTNISSILSDDKISEGVKNQYKNISIFTKEDLLNNRNLIDESSLAIYNLLTSFSYDVQSTWKENGAATVQTDNSNTKYVFQPQMLQSTHATELNTHIQSQIQENNYDQYVSGEVIFLNIDKTAFKLVDKLQTNDAGLVIDKDNKILFSAENAKGKVVIPDTIQRIQKGAFENNKEVTEVFIPKTVQVVEKNAFTGCDNLQIKTDADKKPDTWDDNFTDNNSNITYDPPQQHTHEYGEWIIDKEPTCTEDGSKHRECECGEIETAVIDKLGHDWDTEWTNDKEATCTEAGSKSHHCKRCNEKKDITIIDKLNHKPAVAVKENVVAATCTTEGSYDEVIYCSVCHTEISRVTKTIPKLNHKYGEWIIDKEPTCTETGSKHKTCECGATITEDIPALGHDWDTEWTIDKEATEFEEGSRSHHCKRCDAKTDVEVIDKLPLDSNFEYINLEKVNGFKSYTIKLNPQTGDLYVLTNSSVGENTYPKTFYDSNLNGKDMINNVINVLKNIKTFEMKKTITVENSTYTNSGYFGPDFLASSVVEEGINIPVGKGTALMLLPNGEYYIDNQFRLNSMKELRDIIGLSEIIVGIQNAKQKENADTYYTDKIRIDQDDVIFDEISFATDKLILDYRFIDWHTTKTIQTVHMELYNINKEKDVIFSNKYRNIPNPNDSNNPPVQGHEFGSFETMKFNGIGDNVQYQQCMHCGGYLFDVTAGEPSTKTKLFKETVVNAANYQDFLNIINNADFLHVKVNEGAFITNVYIQPNLYYVDSEAIQQWYFCGDKFDLNIQIGKMGNVVNKVEPTTDLKALIFTNNLLLTQVFNNAVFDKDNFFKGTFTHKTGGGLMNCAFTMEIQSNQVIVNNQVTYDDGRIENICIVIDNLNTYISINSPGFVSTQDDKPNVPDHEHVFGEFITFDNNEFGHLSQFAECDKCSTIKVKSAEPKKIVSDLPTDFYPTNCPTGNILSTTRETLLNAKFLSVDVVIGDGIANEQYYMEPNIFTQQIFAKMDGQNLVSVGGNLFMRFNNELSYFITRGANESLPEYTITSQNTIDLIFGFLDLQVIFDHAKYDEVNNKYNGEYRDVYQTQGLEELYTYSFTIEPKSINIILTLPDGIVRNATIKGLNVCRDDFVIPEIVAKDAEQGLKPGPGPDPDQGGGKPHYCEHSFVNSVLLSTPKAGFIPKYTVCEKCNARLFTFDENKALGSSNHNFFEELSPNILDAAKEALYKADSISISCTSENPNYKTAIFIQHNAMGIFVDNNSGPDLRLVRYTRYLNFDNYTTEITETPEGIVYLDNYKTIGTDYTTLINNILHIDLIFASIINPDAKQVEFKGSYNFIESQNGLKKDITYNYTLTIHQNSLNVQLNSENGRAIYDISINNNTQQIPLPVDPIYNSIDKPESGGNPGEIPEETHQFMGWEEVSMPSLNSDAVFSRICPKCGKIETRTLPMPKPQQYVKGKWILNQYSYDLDGKYFNYYSVIPNYDVIGHPVENLFGDWTAICDDGLCTYSYRLSSDNQFIEFHQIMGEPSKSVQFIDNFEQQSDSRYINEVVKKLQSANSFKVVDYNLTSEIYTELIKVNMATLTTTITNNYAPTANLYYELFTSAGVYMIEDGICTLDDTYIQPTNQGLTNDVLDNLYINLILTDAVNTKGLSGSVLNPTEIVPPTDGSKYIVNEKFDYYIEFDLHMLTISYEKSDVYNDNSIEFVEKHTIEISCLNSAFFNFPTLVTYGGIQVA